MIASHVRALVVGAGVAVGVTAAGPASQAQVSGAPRPTPADPPTSTAPRPTPVVVPTRPDVTIQPYPYPIVRRPDVTILPYPYPLPGPVWGRLPGWGNQLPGRANGWGNPRTPLYPYAYPSPIWVDPLAARPAGWGVNSSAPQGLTPFQWGR